MRHESRASDRLEGGVHAPSSIGGQAEIKGLWECVIRDPDGNVIRREQWENLVVNEGLDELLTMALTNGTPETAWYVGLTTSGPSPAAGDTMGSHGGWTEQQGYDEAARQAWTDGGVSGQSVDNSASKATFTITNGSTTIGGAFLTSDNTKGGTTGKLYSVGAFTGGDVTLSAGSTLEVTATFTTAAA